LERELSSGEKTVTPQTPKKAGLIKIDVDAGRYPAIKTLFSDPKIISIE
jgi:hypothetical protein